MRMPWFCWHNGTTSDPKFRLAAKRSGVPLSVTIAVWATMGENASESATRGTLSGWNPEIVATSLDVTTEQVQAVFESLQGLCLEGDRLSGWEKRNPGATKSTERVHRH